MGRIWANFEFELSQILESCSVWNQAGEGIESRQRQQQVAEKQLQLFFIGCCNFGRDFRQNQFLCHQHYVQTIFMKELLHTSTTNIIQIQSISPSTRHRIEPFILQVNNHLQNALCLRRKKTILALVQNLFIGIVQSGRWGGSNILEPGSNILEPLNFIFKILGRIEEGELW